MVDRRSPDRIGTAREDDRTQWALTRTGAQEAS